MKWPLSFVCGSVLARSLFTLNTPPPHSPFERVPVRTVSLRKTTGCYFQIDEHYSLTWHKCQIVYFMINCLWRILLSTHLSIEVSNFTHVYMHLFPWISLSKLGHSDLEFWNCLFSLCASPAYLVKSLFRAFKMTIITALTTQLFFSALVMWNPSYSECSTDCHSD